MVNCSGLPSFTVATTGAGLGFSLVVGFNFFAHWAKSNTDSAARVITTSFFMKKISLNITLSPAFFTTRPQQQNHKFLKQVIAICGVLKPNNPEFASGLLIGSFL
jgi:hypothetical protein